MQILQHIHSFIQHFSAIKLIISWHYLSINHRTKGVKLESGSKNAFSSTRVICPLLQIPAQHTNLQLCCITAVVAPSVLFIIVRASCSSGLTAGRAVSITLAAAVSALASATISMAGCLAGCLVSGSPVDLSTTHAAQHKDCHLLLLYSTGSTELILQALCYTNIGTFGSRLPLCDCPNYGPLPAQQQCWSSNNH